MSCQPRGRCLLPQGLDRLPLVQCLSSMSGVALTFEKLRIANAQHGKNCVSSPAAKTTISTDLPKICPGHDHAGLQTAHSTFWLRHQQYVGTRIPSPGWDGEEGGQGNLRCLDPRQVFYKPSLLGAKNEKTKSIMMCEVTVLAYSKCMAFSDLRILLFFFA